MMCIVSSRAGQTHFAQLRCEADELGRRVTRTDRKAAGKQAGVELLREYLERWDALGAIPDVPSLELDTTHLPPDEAARLIAGHFELVLCASVDDISSASSGACDVDLI
jgi:hypothetical protein